MGLIFNESRFNQTMAHFNYDVNKVPLGKLSKKTLVRGYQKLEALAVAINNNTDGVDVQKLSDKYLTLIPHNFGTKSVPVISTLDQIKREIELLESLTNIQLADGLMKSVKTGTFKSINPIDDQYHRLGMQEITPLEVKEREFIEL